MALIVTPEDAERSKLTLPPSLIEAVTAKCIINGVMMRKADGSLDPIPITLQPQRLPRSSYDYVTELMPLWNKIIDRVARDYDFLVEELEPIAQSDVAFTRKLLDIYSRLYISWSEKHKETAAAKEAAPLQESMLGIFRSDYMRDKNAVEAGDHDPSVEWKHIEINTIAASFGPLCTKTGEVHKFLAASLQQHPLYRVGGGPGKYDLPLPPDSVVVSSAFDAVPEGLAIGQREWIKESDVDLSEPLSPNHTGPVVCFVCEKDERNTTDQYLVATELLQRHGVPSIRKSFSELQTELRLVKPKNGNGPPTAVVRDGQTDLRVAVFYFRTGYAPQNFSTEDLWAVREEIEKSSAVKCPSVPHHLCTSKQIQVLLARPDVLRRYATEKEASILERSFVGQYPVGSHVGPNDAVERAIKEPHRYVLKSQLEGGGNLIDGDRMVSLMQEVLRLEGEEGQATATAEEKAEVQRLKGEHLLMEKIVSAVQPGCVLRHGASHFFPDLSPELGTFGLLLSRPNDEVPVNRYGGYLIRTKPFSVSDGGVMTGISALDVIALVD